MVEKESKAVEQRIIQKNNDYKTIQNYNTEELNTGTRDVSEMSDDERIDYAAERILKKYRKAFETLAK